MILRMRNIAAQRLWLIVGVFRRKYGMGWTWHVPMVLGQTRYGLSFLKRVPSRGTYPSIVNSIGVPKPVTKMAML
jgi:hypothetical protein